MSPKETILDLIEDLPGQELGKIISYIKFIKYSYENEDDYFMDLADKAENDGEFVNLDDAVKEMGFNLDELRD